MFRELIKSSRSLLVPLVKNASVNGTVVSSGLQFVIDHGAFGNGLL